MLKVAPCTVVRSYGRKELQEGAEFYQIEGLLEKLKVNSESLTSVKLNVGGHHFKTSL